MNEHFEVLGDHVGDIALLAVKNFDCRTFYAREYRHSGIADVVLLKPDFFEAVIIGLTHCNRDHRFTQVRLYTTPPKPGEEWVDYPFYVYAVSEEGLVIPCTHYSSPNNNPLLYSMAKENNTEWSAYEQFMSLGEAYFVKAILLLLVGAALMWWGDKTIIEIIGVVLVSGVGVFLLNSIFGGKWIHEQRRKRIDLAIRNELGDKYPSVIYST